jgi:membrane protein implicated in regulation of membrane protease activity
MDWLPDVYLVCALVGGTILVLQTVMMLFGIGGDHDAGGDIGPDSGDLSGHDVGHVGDELSFLKWLSLKTIVSSLTFFGLAGIAAGKAGWSPWAGLSVAVAAGTAAVVALAFLMASLAKLQSRGNVDLKNAVGHTARVYLRIPGSRRGTGKITVEVQGRSIEAAASTNGPDIPTGDQVRVLGLVADDTFDVTPLVG